MPAPGAEKDSIMMSLWLPGPSTQGARMLLEKAQELSWAGKEEITAPGWVQSKAMQGEVFYRTVSCRTTGP